MVKQESVDECFMGPSLKLCAFAFCDDATSSLSVKRKPVPFLSSPTYKVMSSLWCALLQAQQEDRHFNNDDDMRPKNASVRVESFARPPPTITTKKKQSSHPAPASHARCLTIRKKRVEREIAQDSDSLFATTVKFRTRLAGMGNPHWTFQSRLG